MSRVALGIAYDGTDFVGWQAQASGRSVQAVLEAAVARVAAHDVTLYAAGRTDAGVHASYQVAHFDSVARRTEREWRLGINANLPEDVSVGWVKAVPADFDARRSARARTYRYLIRAAETRSALAYRRLFWVREPLDHALMTAAGAYLIGEHDFSAFRASGCQSSTPMRCLTSLEVHRRSTVLALDFTANAFLYRMVRNLVGLIVAVGKRELAPSVAREVLAGRDRRAAPATAPAAGLTLIDVAYAAEYAFPPREETWLTI
jgi:tRNA pseudouridine38-40 synthase